MDVHKPKRVHNWREFVGEVGIIVLGVLIALAAEQIVEQLRWRERVETARDALHAEIRENLGAIALRESQQACVSRRLADLKLVFRLHAENKPLRLTGPVSRPPHYTGSLNVWKLAAADQTVSHMPYAERLAISRAYDNYQGFNDMRAAETTAWTHLDALDAPETLTASDWTALREAYTEASGANDRLQTVMTYVGESQTLGLKPESLVLPKNFRQQQDQFCRPLGS